MLRRASRGIVRAGGLALLAMCFAAPSAFALGGPVILGGDDLTSHGGLDAMGNSTEGWLYMDKAIGNISPRVTKPNNGSIAAIGSADPGPLAAGDSGDAGKGIAHAAVVNGLTVRYADGDAAIKQIFAEIANGSYTPRIIWIAGDEANNDFSESGGCSGPENAALTANGAVINNFVNAGGGLMSHGTCYQWLSALLPGLTTVNNGNSDDLVRTPAGAAAFPGVTDADFNAGPWHNYFQGNFGGLQALVVSKTGLDASGLKQRVVIGGSAVSIVPAPRIAVAGVAGSRRGTCTARNFTSRVTITTSNLRSATVYLDGRRIDSTSRRVFNVRVMAQSLASRTHTLRVIAVDRSGKRAVTTRSFRRCARISVLPRFTG